MIALFLLNLWETPNCVGSDELEDPEEHDGKTMDEVVEVRVAVLGLCAHGASDC